MVRDPARERAVPPAGFFFRGVAVFLRDDTAIASSLAAVSGAQVYRVTAPAASRTVGAHRAEAERTAASGRVGTSSRALAALSDTSAAAVIAPFALRNHWRADMADNPGMRGPRDRERIDIHQEHEVRYWTEKLGVTPEELRDAVEAVGPMASAVEQRVRGRSRRGAQ
jgi:hypothetical protein